MIYFLLWVLVVIIAVRCIHPRQSMDLLYGELAPLISSGQIIKLTEKPPYQSGEIICIAETQSGDCYRLHGAYGLFCIIDDVEINGWCVTAMRCDRRGKLLDTVIVANEESFYDVMLDVLEGAETGEEL